MSALRTAWLAWGAVVALLAYPAQAQIIGQQSSILGGEEGFFRPTGGGAVPWTPADLGASLALWLDADDASTITLNGTNVVQWDDKSGNGRNASQPTASFQPTYLATGFNGKPTLQTDGSDALELGVTSLGRNVSGLTCALVGLHPVGTVFTSNANELFISSGANSASTRFAVTPNPSTSTINRYGIAGRRLDADGYTTVSSSTDSLANRGNPWIRVAQRAYSDGVANHWTDGTQDMTNEVVGTQGAGNTSDTDPLRTVLFNGVSALPNGSQLSEIVLTHSTMTTDDRQKLEGYLAWKWGLTANLPAGHPYKSAPPTTGGASTVTIDAMPYTRTVTCDTYTVTGTYTGTAPTTWSASPSGDTGSCTDLGGGTFSCVVDVDPDASGEGVETITIGNDSVDIGFYVSGSHSCFLAQSVDGNYNSTLADNDPVATWENLGTSALDVTQGTAANQPTLKTSIVGGQPVVRCDGGDRVVAATASDWDFMSDLSTFSVESVSNKPTDTNTYDFIVASGTGATGSFLGQDYRTATARQAFGHNGSRAEINSNQLGVFIGLSAVFEDTGGTDGTLTQNGSTSATFFGATSQPAPHALVICGSASTFPFTGDVFRALIYQSALDATQRAINQSVDEWALGGTLPVTP
jgi:hypothetical protein